MKPVAIPPQIIEELKKAQRNEITEHHIYLKLAGSIKDKHNSEVLKKIGNDEKAHYEVWKKYTATEVKPSKWRIFKFFWIARIFGITFLTASSGRTSRGRAVTASATTTTMKSMGVIRNPPCLFVNLSVMRAKKVSTR